MINETLRALSLQDLLTEVADPRLASGGIGMAGLMGAVAGALITLVGRLTAGKVGYEPMTEEMERLIERSGVLQDHLLALMDQEVGAFNQLVEASALPRASADEQAIRRDCMRIALRSYSQVPLEIAQTCLEIVRLAETASRYGNRSAHADAGTAMLAAASGGKAACLHVLINLGGAEEEEWAIAAREKVDKLLMELGRLEGELWGVSLQQVGHG